MYKVLDRTIKVYKGATERTTEIANSFNTNIPPTIFFSITMIIFTLRQNSF